jgi:uncharacterized protein YqhQ
MEDRIITYGGQAVIEGVLMRGQKALALAMRAPNGEIVVHTEKLSGLYQSRLAKIPFLRGIILLSDALSLGMKALIRAANTQTGEDEKLEGPALYLTLFISLAFGIGLFFLAPYGAAKLIQWLAGLAAANAPSAGVAVAGVSLAGLGDSNQFATNIWVTAAIEGVTRLALIVGYIWAIGRVPDIQRVFQYHGAEHKTINAFEAGIELTPENVARYPLEHPRCGTSFLLTLVILSIFAFSLLHPLAWVWQVLGRILFIPILAGIALEYIRWTANHLDSSVVRAMIRPNLALQSLTTREPDLAQLEVAIRAFNEMRLAEENA